MTTEPTAQLDGSSASPALVVLDFWFGSLDSAGNSDLAHRQRWWTKEPAFDLEVRERFGGLFATLVGDPTPRAVWTRSPRGLLAAIIALDQFPRNMFRDTPGMYAGDTLSLRFAFELIALGYDKTLPFSLRTFAYMPLMHSERLEDQERCIELFQDLANELSGEEQKSAAANAGYAIQHRDIVARFGRFPHRNKIVGRASTAEEIEFLKGPGSSF